MSARVLSNIQDQSLDDSLRTYRLILTHTPASVFVGAGLPPNRKAGIYTWRIPPLQDMTNSTDFNQCFISLNKVLVDPVSINEVGLRNKNPAWVNTQGFINGAGAPRSYSVGGMILNLSLPSRNTGLIQTLANSSENIDNENLYKYQELVYFERHTKANYQGENPDTFVRTDVGILDVDLGTRSTNSTVAGQNWGNQTKDGTGFNVLRNAANSDKQVQVDDGEIIQDVNNHGFHNTGLTGNSVFYAYEPTKRCRQLCGNPFGAELSLKFMDSLSGGGPMMLQDVGLVGTDIGVVQLELEVTMVRNRPAQ